GPLPRVLVVDLRHRHLVAMAQAVHDRPDRGALRLQRPALGDVELEAHGRGMHDDYGSLAIGCGAFGIPSLRCVRTDPLVPPRPTGDANGFTPRSDAGDFAVFVGLDHVAGLEVLVVLEPDTALETFPHLAHVVLEAPQRSDRALPDDRALAQEPDLRP